jgi:hypothetical protein
MRLAPLFFPLPLVARLGRGGTGHRCNIRPSLLFRAGLQIIAALALAAVARAQSVRWAPADSGVAQAAVLVFEDCSPDGEPQLPAVPGVTFTRVGESSNMSIVNGAVTRSILLSYLIRARQSGPVAIPGFTVRTDKGVQRVAPFTVGAPAAPVDSFATARLIPERASVWAGEVFGLNYELSASRRTNPQIQPQFEWNAAPLVAEDWSKPEVTDAVVGNDRRVNVVFRTRAIARTPNTLKLEAANHFLTIQTGTIGFGIISQPRMEQVSVTSDQPVVEVRALPAPPAGFGGAVGQFKLVSKVVPEKAAIGEPVTWTLELSGAGNWPDLAALPAREVSNDFQVVQPKAKRTPAEGKLFDATLSEDVVLVPGKAGSYTLGPVTFTYFDPKAGAYKTLTAPKTTVTITNPVAPKFNVTPAPDPATEPNPGDPAQSRIEDPKSKITAPKPPSGLPRDPLPGAASAAVPLGAREFVLWLLSPVPCLLLLWLALALRRAAQTDPLRPRRDARARLAATLEKIQASTSTSDFQLQQQPLLLHWQRDAAVLWQIPHAAPGANTIARLEAGGDAAPSPRSPEHRGEGAAAPASEWAQLWIESDRALYGANPALPADWVARAQAALAAHRVPGFRPLRLFLARNLFPFAAGLAVLLGAGAEWLHAAVGAAPDAPAAYRKGDFATAEKMWRATVAKSPTDPIARHNLSLALAQQGRAPEAAAWAASAFVQEPGRSALKWHFRHGSEQAGAAPGPLAAFVSPGPAQSLAEHHSPAQWQTIAIAASWIGAVALGVLLAGAYGRRSAAVVVLAWILFATSLGGSFVAVAGWWTYGAAADARAAIVARAGTLRTIPTEADTTQKTSPLAAGTLAIAGKDFLGWQHLTFENGQTGWVRKEELVPLWR